MANASVKEAPVKEKGPSTPSKEERFMAQQFDPAKRYMFELADENMERQLPVIDMHTRKPAPHKRFRPYQNLVMTSQVVWKGARRMVRYYDGCDSIFVDEQPKDKDVMEQFIRQTQRRQFVEGKLGVYGDERMLLLFLFISSFNVESEFRTRTADGIFRPVNTEKKATAESERLDQAEKALELAKSVDYQRLLIHSDYLGVPLTDFDSGNELSEKEVRTAYRRKALDDPKTFMKSYFDKSLEMKYYVKKAIGSGLIDTISDPNNALWSSSKRKIKDISGLKSFDAISDALVEFSLTEDGEEFKIQLLALFKNQ